MYPICLSQDGVSRQGVVWIQTTFSMLVLATGNRVDLDCFFNAVSLARQSNVELEKANTKRQKVVYSPLNYRESLSRDQLCTQFVCLKTESRDRESCGFRMLFQ
ncbi:hypothetical protein PEPS_33140 (plasmid) [Persicobacter psychrovividus]|uniref:Uncharacterized protein n=1 Tax=Persicobacter psychrovividus TaxID=387638 RepID=A0ABM7VJB7_9BACT|nr:hypothetical protein PEPS_33140 [Persicobacter psychrovividus]